MKLIIDISKDDLDAIKYLKVKGWASRHELQILNGTPYETVTEFADRCKECGAKYGKLLKQEFVLDNIRAEIEQEIIPRNSDQYDHEAKWQNLGLRMALKVIDKYNAESKEEGTGNRMTDSMTNEEAIKMLKSLVEVRRKYGDMQTMKDEIECLNMAIKALEIFEQAKEAGFHGKEVEFYIGGRKFAIRELAQ